MRRHLITPPPRPVCNEGYARALFTVPKTSLALRIGFQVTRVLAFALVVLLTSFAIDSMRDDIAHHLWGHGNFLRNFTIVLCAWSGTVLCGRIVAESVRSWARLPWRDEPTRVASAVGRGFVGVLWFFIMSSVTGKVPLAIAADLVCAAAMFGQGMLSAWRSRRECALMLSSLPRSLAVRSPRDLDGDAGRVVVAGRRVEPAVIEADGVRMDFGSVDAITHLVELVPSFDPPVETTLVAHAFSDGVGYRSSDVRLEARGLPVWKLPSDDATLQLERFRKRLELVRLVDAILLRTAQVVTIVALPFVVAALF